MTKFLPFLLLPLVACGPNAELVRYTIDVQMQDVPDWLNPESAGVYHQVAPCTNAEVFDQTLRVYDGWVEGAVAAVTFHWTGFDLSNGGENTETHFILDGETLDVVAALKPDTVLYRVDHKGRMLEVDKDVAKVKSKDSAEATYDLGEGLPIGEVHELQKEVDLVDFIDEGAWNCEQTQF